MRKTKEYPSQEELRRMFYCTEGNLVWKKRPESDFANKRAFTGWNKKNAGQVAGTPAGHASLQIYVKGKTYNALKLSYIYHFGPTEHGVSAIDGNGANLAPENLKLGDGKQRSCRKIEGSRDWGSTANMLMQTKLTTSRWYNEQV